KFDGPDMASPAISSHDVFDSFEDRKPGLDPTNGPSLLLPWVSYLYSQSNNAASYGLGVQTVGSEGGQSAFQVVTNPPNPGAFSGFGMYLIFTNQWALPA